MKKHKLEGYCIRGGEEIAERIRKVFEADGVDCGRWRLSELSINRVCWYSDYRESDIDLYCHDYDHLKEITIDQAERIVFGESEKTFPRMMEVSDDGERWYEGRVVSYIESDLHPWVAKEQDTDRLAAWKHAREIKPELSTEITDEVMIKAVERLCEVFKDYSERCIDSLRFWGDGDITIHKQRNITHFNSIHELIKHLRDEK